MGISLSTALEESKGNSDDNTIYGLHLLERNALRKLEQQASILHLKALNDKCLPIVCAVDKKQMILLKIDAVPKIDQVRHSLNGLLRGNYLGELVVLLTEKLNNVLESAKMSGDTDERLFRYVVFANKSILRLDVFVYYRSFLPNESLKDYNNVLAYFIQVGLLDILKARPQVLIYELTRATKKIKLTMPARNLRHEKIVQGNLASSCNTWAKFPQVSTDFGCSSDKDISFMDFLWANVTCIGSK